MLAEHRVNEIAVSVDGSIQVSPPATNLQVGLVHVPAAAAGTALAMPALAEFVGEQRCKLRLPLADGLVAKHDAAEEEHLGQVAPGQAVAQPPQHHERDHVRGVLGVVQHGAGALVVLLAAGPAAEPAIALGGALRPLGHRGRAAGHTVHLRPPSSPEPEPTSPTPAGQTGRLARGLTEPRSATLTLLWRLGFKPVEGFEHFAEYHQSAIDNVSGKRTE